MSKGSTAVYIRWNAKPEGAVHGLLHSRKCFKAVVAHLQGNHDEKVSEDFLRRYPSEHEEYFREMARWGIPYGVTEDVKRDASTIQGLTTEATKRGLTPREQNRVKSLQARIIEALRPYRQIRAVFSDDPSRACVSLKVPRDYASLDVPTRVGRR